VAYLTVNCPYYNSNASTCNTASCQVNNIPAFGDKEWEQYKAMYYSLKRALVERRATKYAINNGCYNGCMDI